MTETNEAKRIQLSGRLLEIDYRCRTAELWDALGRMTLVHFTRALLDNVDTLRQQKVVVNAIHKPSAGGKAAITELVSVQPIHVDEAFWHPPSIQDLAEQQHVKPVEDARDLSAADVWAEDDIDEFINTVRQWRNEA